MANALVYNEVYNAVLQRPFTPQNFGSSLVQIEADIQRRFLGGVDAVVYCKSAVPGWSQVPNNKGIIAILIGIQSPRDSASGQVYGSQRIMQFGIQSPRDSASGQATGKRVHKPLFLKRTGAYSIAESGVLLDWIQG